MMKPDFRGKLVTVLGGTGFLGRYIVSRLAEAGASVRVVTRRPHSAYFLRVLGAPGQIYAVRADYSSPESVATLVRGSFAVVNCLGILHDNGSRGNFTHLHTDVPARIAKACFEQGIERFVHISSLGVDKAESEYAISKISGETLAQREFAGMTILRPSVLFGAEDAFFNRFATAARRFHVLPVLFGGKTKFSPVYVGDVATAVLYALAQEQTAGRVYELGGPEIVTFKEIYARIKRYTGLSFCEIPVPEVFARIQAFALTVVSKTAKFFLPLFPDPALTNDQITSLKTDNIVQPGALGFSDLGIKPVTMDSVVPTYLRYIHYTAGQKG